METNKVQHLSITVNTTSTRFPWPPLEVLDAGVLYFLRKAIDDFFDTGLSTGNQLLKAVEADSNVNAYWATCNALGLISKIVTGPFWRLLESVSLTHFRNYQREVGRGCITSVSW